LLDKAFAPFYSPAKESVVSPNLLEKKELIIALPFRTSFSMQTGPFGSF
jgi:hypothetical protein